MACIACTAAVPGSRGPAQVPITPWPCSRARSRSSRTCSSTTSAIERCRSTSRASGSSPSSSASSARSGLGPTQVSRGPVRSATPDALEQRLVGAVAVDVGGRERGDLRERALGVGVDGDRRAVGERAPEARGRAATRSNPWRRRSSSSTTSGCSRPDDVRARADEVAVVGERPVQRGGAAELLAGLQHEHGTPGAGEVGGRGEPVVAAADHHDVPPPGGQLASPVPAARPDPTRPERPPADATPSPSPR